MTISELKAGASIEMTLLIFQVKAGVTNSKAPYLSITLKDQSGSIEGKLWDVKPAQSEIIEVGKVLVVKGDVINYKDNLQIKINSISLPQQPIDYSLFVNKGPYSKQQLQQYIDGQIGSINNQNLFRIVNSIYRQYHNEIYFSAAAAKNHHEFVSGLATHVYSMLHLANSMCENYKSLNRDLLISGVLLHDIGKVIELKTGPVTEYTVEGKLLGHISISQTIIQQTADQLQIEGQEVTLLRHMVLSHHGQYEFGSPVLPMIIEAEALHFIDDIDAKLTMIEKELQTVKPNEFTSRLFALDNRSFYKHNL